MKCEICNNEVIELTKCQICGKKVCNDCLRVITRPFHLIWYSASTVPPTGYLPSTIPYSSSKKSNFQDIYICKNCSDLLSLSLRIAKAKYEE